MEKKQKLLALFIAFLKIGAFTFGGGYAMIELIRREVVERRRWITEEDLLDMVAIAESTPGPIAINSATFVGCKVAGFWGAFCATLGVVLPSFLTILLLSDLLRRVQNFRAVRYVFFGLRAGVLALLCKALWNMYRACPKGVVAYILMAAAFIATAVFDVNVFIILVLCALIGLLSSLIAARRVG